MTTPVFFKSDYTLPDKESENTFGKFTYEITGMEHPEKLFKIIPVKPGLFLSFSENSTVKFPDMEFEIKNSPVGFSFFLSGTCVHKFNNFKSKKTVTVTHKPGMNTIFSIPNVTGDMTFDQDKYIACVDLKIDRGLLFSYLQENIDQLSPRVLDLFDDKKQLFFSCPMTRQMLKTTLDIIHPPAYNKNTLSLFYESRALELLALQLEFLSSNNLFQRPFQINNSDLEGIHEARRILLQDIQNPPTIANLARLCGINEFKLKKGFKLTFNATIFSYLKKFRMEQAWHMFTDNNTSVTEAASMVGYTNVSHFITAFKNQFKISPGTLKRTVNPSMIEVPFEPDHLRD